MYIKLIIYCNLLILAVMAGEVDDKCKPNMDIKDGTCKLVIDCEVALRSIKRLQSHPFSRCGFTHKYEIVCCPNEIDLDPTVTRLPPGKPTPSSSDDNKFGEIGSRTLRVADRACQEIIRSFLPPLGLHIIGGVEASLGEFPHMVALGYGGPDTYDFLCGASLLSDVYALTAAHCVDTLTHSYNWVSTKELLTTLCWQHLLVTNVSVKLGLSNLFGGDAQIKPTIARMGVIEIGKNTWTEQTDYRITQILTHPNYVRRTKYHDLSLIRIEKPVKFSVNLSPVCLYTSNQDPKIELTITGWGKTSTTRDVKSTILLKANVTVVSKSECGVSYTNWRKLPEGIMDEQICAGDPQGLKDTCQGDSGGPLQGLADRDGQYRLVGVTSFGRGCGSPVPGVYTRVANYLEWIESVVWPNGFDTWA